MTAASSYSLSSLSLSSLFPRSSASAAPDAEGFARFSTALVAANNAASAAVLKLFLATALGGLGTAFFLPAGPVGGCSG